MNQEMGMSTYPRSVDQDDVLGQGSVESSAFGNGGEAHHQEDLHASLGSEKPKRNPLLLWVIGGLGGAAMVTVAAVLFLGGRGSGNDDASFAQVAPAAPRPQMDATVPANTVATAVPSTSMPTADPINGDAVTIGSEASSEPPIVATASAVAPSPQDTAVAPPPTRAESATSAPASLAKPTPVVTAAAPASAAQKSDSERLRDLEANYEALSGDYARLNEKFLRASAAAEQRRAEARTSAARQAPPKPVASKVPGVQLKAVVDNNAWVQTESGDSVMVSPGDEIPGVGQVRSVDPETGTVHLSDGRVIR